MCIFSEASETLFRSTPLLNMVCSTLLISQYSLAVDLNISTHLEGQAYVGKKAGLVRICRYMFCGYLLNLCDRDFQLVNRVYSTK